MSPEEAEKVVNEYGAAIASIEDGDIAQDLFGLPHSPGKIRFAIFVYTKALIDDGLFNEEIENQLGGVYAMLDSRFTEDAEKINWAWHHFKTSSKARAYLDQRGGVAGILSSVDKITEYHNFVADCYGNWVATKG